MASPSRGRGAKPRLVGGCRGARGAWTADHPDRCRTGVCEITGIRGCPLPTVLCPPTSNSVVNVSVCLLPASLAPPMDLGSPLELDVSLHGTDRARRTVSSLP